VGDVVIKHLAERERREERRVRFFGGGKAGKVKMQYFKKLSKKFITSLYSSDTYLTNPCLGRIGLAFKAVKKVIIDKLIAELFKYF
jgi:hypothetical protein